MEQSELTIGALAQLAGVRTSKIRYYEDVGLLSPKSRISGRRRYAPDAVDTLALIQFAQDAGFSIAEIRHVLAGFDRRTPPSKRWQDVAQRKLADVNTLIEHATRMRGVLEALLTCRCIQLADCVDECRGPIPLTTLTLRRPRGVNRPV